MLSAYVNNVIEEGSRKELEEQFIKLYIENAKLHEESREQTKRIQELEMEVWNL